MNNDRSAFLRQLAKYERLNRILHDTETEVDVLEAKSENLSEDTLLDEAQDRWAEACDEATASLVEIIEIPAQTIEDVRIKLKLILADCFPRSDLEESIYDPDRDYKFSDSAALGRLLTDLDNLIRAGKR